MPKPQERALAFLIGVIGAIIFPWWVWVVTLIIATWRYRPYWEGVILVLMYEHMYGAIISDSALLLIGDWPLRIWPLYVFLVLGSLLWKHEHTSRVY